MKFEDLLGKARKIAGKTDVSDVDFLAVQINITEPDGGVFYVEVKDHKVSVEPYEYYDLLKFLDGDIDVGKAYDEGVIKVDGDLGKAAWFSDLLHRK